jgi:hypothetical protein
VFGDSGSKEARTRLMASRTACDSSVPAERLTPWMVFDLERIAWVMEYRAEDLTPEERRIAQAAAQRLLRAVGGS